MFLGLAETSRDRKPVVSDTPLVPPRPSDAAPDSKKPILQLKLQVEYPAHSPVAQLVERLTVNDAATDGGEADVSGWRN